MMRKKDVLNHKKRDIFILSIIALSFVSFFLDNFFFSSFDRFNPEIMTVIMEFFSSSLVIALFFIIISIFLLKKTHNFILIWASIIFTAIIVFTLKFIIARPRPDGLHMSLMGLADYSFPSMHTALMFSTVYVLWRSFPKERWFFIIYAVMVGISRIYLQVHYLSDVVFGAFIGFSLGYFIFMMEEKHKTFIKFKKRLNLD